jgi:hypothetical protein
MAIDFKSSINLGKNQLQNAALHPTSTAPSNPVEGQVYFNTTSGDKKLYVHDGTTWIDVTGDIRSISAGTGIAVTNGSGGDATVALSHLGIQDLGAPESDSIFFYDTSASAAGYLTTSSSTGITIDGTSLKLASIPNASLTNSSITISGGNGITTTAGATSLGGSSTVAIDLYSGGGLAFASNQLALDNADNLTQYTLLMWGADKLEQPDIVRTVDQSNNETITFGGSVVIDQNLTVNGTVTTINTETIALADNIIELNSNLGSSTAPTESAGITINRGSATDKSFVWDEAYDVWRIGGELIIDSIDQDTSLVTTDFVLMPGDNANDGIKKARLSDVATAIGVGNHSILLDSVNRDNVTKSGNTYTVTHNLGSQLVRVEVVGATNYETVFVETARPTTNTVTIAFGQSVTEGTYICMTSLVGNLDNANAAS